MAGARDVTNATRRIRAEQKRRNEEALALAQERQTRLEEEHAHTRPSERRRQAGRAAGVHRVKQGDPPQNKMLTGDENKGDTVLRFASQQAKSLVEEFLAEHSVGSEPYQTLVELLAEVDTGGEGLSEDDVQAAIGSVTATLAEEAFSALFASQQAAQLAGEMGLTAEDFEPMIPSGTTGFTVADVRAMAAGD